ncbi:hypothetical protein LCGC14_1145250 [marine sediment metagenome]|uniref:HD domain-containing protein n=1 Tax=marine sediment metagenome TaxID=412755 RepID=A0A0F9LX24_9ZZZZ
MNESSDNITTVNEIKDEILIKHYYKLIEKGEIEFLKEMDSFNINDEELDDESKYKDINDKKLVQILKDLIIDVKKDEDQEKLRILKLKKKVFQKLWPNFVRSAIKYLRIKDTRDKCEFKFDFGVKNLTKYFEEFSKFEEILYGVDEYYRDHSLHVFRVYLLGEYLGRKLLKGFDQLKITTKSLGINDNIIYDEKEAIWCVIALCHDLGYPLQKLDQLNKKLVKILEFFGTSNFNPLRYSLPLEGTILDKFILKLISSRINEKLKIQHQPKFYAKYSKAYEKLSHGIMSCILLMKNLVYFKETDYEPEFEKGYHYEEKSKNNSAEKGGKEFSDETLEDARQYVIRREILRSIASHDNEDIYHIEMNNFPFLLIMCDEIQEWSRPASKIRFSYLSDPKNIENIQIKAFNENNIDISIGLNFPDKDLLDYAANKYMRFIRLLRSAVHSDRRLFNFKMSIENNKGTKYQFIYDSPVEFYSDEKKNKKEDSYKSPKCIEFKNGYEDPDFLRNIIEMINKK